ncbi:MAG: LuxR C-terminal-related transcriptional regulator [Cyanobacteria bacterium P01_F01_bin.53]
MPPSKPHQLQRLFGEIAQAKNEQGLRSRFIDTIGGHFQAQRWGIYLYSPQGELSSVDIHGMHNVEAFVERYQSIGKAVDPVLKHVETYHTPAHEGLFYTPNEWENSPLYTRCCATMDHAHFMTGPIVGDGHMRGAVYFSRTSGTPAFTHQNLSELGAVCAHLSAQLAAFTPKSELTPTAHKLLITRELQIAELVATGLTNAAISQQLWITENTVKQALKKIFRKLNVNNRAALVAKLLS